ncbi:MAG: phosphatidate cytidylyltransferase [Christensenellaceae bacterium]|jgi:phosphatidate cytidylyltransferase|nr:phosphatidate cytidylyltransferase [Christensenellaceae bacterium]
MKRTLTGLSLLVVFLGILFLTKIHQAFFDIAVFAVIMIALFEMIKCGKASSYNPIIIPLILTTIAMLPLSIIYGLFGFLIVLGLGVLLIFSFFIFDPRIAFKDFIYTVFILIYPVSMLYLAIVIPHFYVLFEPGMIPVLIAIAAALCSDTFAYYFGSFFKGPHIFPAISPNKTYSGCIMGLIGGMIGSILVYVLFELVKLPLNVTYALGNKFSYPLVTYAAIGLLMSFVSQIGDLAASRIKRELEIKDFSGILGSHGGMMDRIDSVMFALVAMTVIVLCGNVFVL